MENKIDLTKIDAEQLCEIFNGKDNFSQNIDTKYIINEFISRKISVVNIQRAYGSTSGKKMQIWYNRERNCIEVSGRCFFEGTNLLKW